MAKRRNLNETRTLLLATGTSMLLDGGIRVTLDVLNLIDVCRAAGLTTAGSAYKIWKNQDDFRADVLDHLVTLTPAGPATVAELTASSRTDHPELPPLAELIRTTAIEPEVLTNNQSGYALYATLLLASRHDEHLAAQLRTTDCELLGSFAGLYDTLTVGYDRVWVQPFNADMLSVTLSALAEGIASRSPTLDELVSTRLMRPVESDGPVRPWSLYATCAEAVIKSFTRPRLPREPAPVPHEKASAPGSDTGPRDPTDPDPEGTAHKRRRSLEETRALLLATATDLLIESGFEVTIGRLELVDVSRAAGLDTAGSAYKIWSTQEAFRVDLMRHLFSISLHGDQTPHLIATALAITPGNVPPLTELIRIMAAENLELNSGTAAICTIALELASRHDPELAAEIRIAELASLERFADIYDYAIAFYAREWRPPFNARILALALNALVHGFTIRELVTPELVPTDLLRPTGPDGAMQPWHLFACAVQATIEAFTRPVTSAEPES